MNEHGESQLREPHAASIASSAAATAAAPSAFTRNEVLHALKQDRYVAKLTSKIHAAHHDIKKEEPFHLFLYSWGSFTTETPVIAEG